jgi:hypothetical protein
MITPEKNDIEISQLFNWGGKQTIYDPSGNLVWEYYARIIGDADLNKSRVYALRCSAEMRSKLRDPESDEHLGFIPDRILFDKESLVNVFLTIKIRDFNEVASKKVNVPFPKELDSEATLEQQEEYQKNVDTYMTKVDAEVKKEIKKMYEAEKSELERISQDELYDKYLPILVNDICQNAMIQQFKDSCVFYGSFKDSAYKEKLFTSLAEFQNLPSTLKDQFIANYEKLDINMDALKKLPGATQ